MNIERMKEMNRREKSSLKERMKINNDKTYTIKNAHYKHAREIKKVTVDLKQ